MKKLSIVCLAVVMAVVFGYGNTFAASAKNTGGVFNLHEVSHSSPDEWYPVFKGSIHTANDKELIAGVSLEIGITTDTTVWSKQLERALANAMAKVEIMVVMNPGYEMSQYDPTKEIWEVGTGRKALPGEVTFAKREQTLIARLAGQLPLVCDETTGLCYVKDEFNVTEIEEEMIRLMLNTLTAHSFNFILPNCPAGTQSIGVFARLTYTDMDNTTPLTDDGFDPASTYGFSHAYLGKGSVTIEEARMVKSDFEL